MLSKIQSLEIVVRWSVAGCLGMIRNQSISWVFIAHKNDWACEGMMSGLFCLTVTYLAGLFASAVLPIPSTVQCQRIAEFGRANCSVPRLSRWQNAILVRQVLPILAQKC